MKRRKQLGIVTGIMTLLVSTIIGCGSTGEMNNKASTLANVQQSDSTLQTVQLPRSVDEKNVKNETEMKKDLVLYKDFFPNKEMNIDELSIIKRQTDLSNKEDLVYVKVNSHNKSMKCDISYELRYTLYNDGWILDFATAYDRENWKILPLVEPSSEEIRDTISWYADRSDKVILKNSEKHFDEGYADYYYTLTKNYKYAVEETTLRTRLYYDPKFYKWVSKDINEINKDYSWQLAGNYIATDEWYNRKCKLTIKQVDKDLIHAIMTSIDNNTIFYDKDIDLSRGEASFSVPISDSGWDTVDMYIKPDVVHTKGRGTRPGCKWFAQ